MTCKTNSSNLSVSQSLALQRQWPTQSLARPPPANPCPGVPAGDLLLPLSSQQLPALLDCGQTWLASASGRWEILGINAQIMCRERYCWSITRQRLHQQSSSPKIPAIAANWGLCCSSLLGVPELQRKEKPAAAPRPLSSVTQAHTRQTCFSSRKQTLMSHFRFHGGVILKDFQGSRVAVFFLNSWLECLDQVSTLPNDHKIISTKRCTNTGLPFIWKEESGLLNFWLLLLNLHLQCTPWFCWWALLLAEVHRGNLYLWTYIWSKCLAAVYSEPPVLKVLPKMQQCFGKWYWALCRIEECCI